MCAAEKAGPLGRFGRYRDGLPYEHIGVGKGAGAVDPAFVDMFNVDECDRCSLHQHVGMSP